MTSAAPTVLVVDDEPDMREVLRALLELDGFEVVGEAGNGVEAVRCFEGLAEPPAAIVLDERMPDLGGIETATRLLASSPNQVIVLFSAALTPEVVERALNVGVLQCVDKLEIARLPRVLRVLLGA
jgi:two-component system chemotaxis response regulator CheY